MIPTSITAAEPVSVVSAARRKAFVDLARESFFSHGYAGTTMSSIAAQAGGSKTTLWSYFPSKQDLFAAVVDDLVERFSISMGVVLEPDMPIDDALRQYGRAMLSTVLTPPIVSLQRLVIGEVGRFPELGRLFYERGAGRGKRKLADYIEGAMADGRVRKGDAWRAASEFSFLCQAGCYQPHLLNVIGDITESRVADDIDAAMETWLAGWRGRKT